MEDPRDQRIRLLERQIAQLRAEHERLKRLYSEAVYAPSYHLGWPARWIERALRRRRAAGGAAAGAPAPVAPPPLEGPPPSVEALAERLLRLSGRG